MSYTSGSVGEPAPPPLSQNPIADRIAAAAEEDRRKARQFDLNTWKQEHFYVDKVFKVEPLVGENKTVVVDFLRYAPADHLRDVWMFDTGHGWSLLVAGSPEDIVYWNPYGAVRSRQEKKRLKVALTRFEQEARPARAFSVDTQDRVYDGETGRYLTDGDPVWIFGDGLTWARSYPYPRPFTPQQLADRCVMWLRKK
jgi:hypothetical protein